MYSCSLSSLNLLNKNYWKSSLSDMKQCLRLAFCRIIQVCSISLIHALDQSGIWQNDLAARNAEASLADLDIVTLNWNMTATSSLSRLSLPNHLRTPTLFPLRISPPDQINLLQSLGCASSFRLQDDSGLCVYDAAQSPDERSIELPLQTVREHHRYARALWISSGMQNLDSLPLSLFLESPDTFVARSCLITLSANRVYV